MSKVDYVALEAQWRRSLHPRPSKHEPVYSEQHILQAAFDGNARCLDMIAFNRAYPTRRHWHHRVHSEFGLPCDSGCAPKRSYTGSNLIERIKNAYRIEDIAEKHTSLRGTHTLSGPCFLHAGSGSEFVVWADEQRWKCFGRCNTGGDVIDLVRAMNEGGIEWQT